MQRCRDTCAVNVQGQSEAGDLENEDVMEEMRRLRDREDDTQMAVEQQQAEPVRHLVQLGSVTSQLAAQLKELPLLAGKSAPACQALALGTSVCAAA